MKCRENLNAGRKATAFMSKQRKRIANIRFTVNQPYLHPFNKKLTVNTGMVMVNYKKYGIIQRQMSEQKSVNYICFFTEKLVDE